MDESGDGQLGIKEIGTGFEKILGKTLDEDTLKQIMSNINTSGNFDDKGEPFLDYSDFLVASIDYSEDQFYQYCERAYELYFDNSMESIDV